MSTAGWILMVGLRVVDVGLLVAWLVWFFRLRDTDEDDPPGDDGSGGGGSEPRTPEAPGGSGDRLPAARRRLRNHSERTGGRRSGRRPERPSSPMTSPARVRRPARAPVPARRA